MTTESREPDLAEELDRADEAAEAEVDEEIPSLAQQRELLRAHVNLGHPMIGRVLPRIAKWLVPLRDCQVDQGPLPQPKVRCMTDAENSTGCGPGKVSRVQPGLRHRQDGSKKPARPRILLTNVARHLSRDTVPPGNTQAGHDRRRNLYHTAMVLVQALRCNGIFDHANLVPTFQQLCQLRGSVPVVTDMEAPWQNAVVETHGALFKMAFDKSVQPGGRSDNGGRSCSRTTSSTPYTIAKDASHEMRRSEVMRMAAAYGCVVAARSPSGVHGSTQSTSKTAAGIGGWRARLHLQTEGRTDPKDGADLACAS